MSVFYRCEDECKLVVCDQGYGLPAGFDPETSGDGLGMKIASAMAQQLGGTLRAGANPAGRGACFTVTFPNQTTVPGG